MIGLEMRVLYLLGNNLELCPRRIAQPPGNSSGRLERPYTARTIRNTGRLNRFVAGGVHLLTTFAKDVLSKAESRKQGIRHGCRALFRRFVCCRRRALDVARGGVAGRLRRWLEQLPFGPSPRGSAIISFEEA